MNYILYIFLTLCVSMPSHTHSAHTPAYATACVAVGGYVGYIIGLYCYKQIQSPLSKYKSDVQVVLNNINHVFNRHAQYISQEEQDTFSRIFTKLQQRIEKIDSIQCQNIEAFGDIIVSLSKLNNCIKRMDSKFTYEYSYRDDEQKVDNMRHTLDRHISHVNRITNCARSHCKTQTLHNWHTYIIPAGSAVIGAFVGLGLYKVCVW